MEYLQSLLDSTDIPVLYAFLLGIMTALSPCPLATNITATAYISRDISEKKNIFINGLLYTLGRALSYTVLGVILYLGASKFQVAKLFQQNGEKLLGPLLIILGIFMLDLIKIKFGGKGNFTDRITSKLKLKGGPLALFLGILFALAFCPYSGVLFFGMLIPMSIASPDGLLLPPVFAFATGLPVIIIAYILAFSVSSIGNFYNKITVFEKWFRKVTGAVFILTGIYLIFTLYF